MSYDIQYTSHFLKWGVAGPLQGDRECVEIARTDFLLYITLNPPILLENFRLWRAFSFFVIIYCCLVTLLSIFCKLFLDFFNILEAKLQNIARGSRRVKFSFQGVVMVKSFRNTGLHKDYYVSYI